MFGSGGNVNPWRPGVVARVGVVAGVVIALLPAGRVAASDDVRQTLYERVFGKAAVLDPEMVAKVKAAKPGEFLLVDSDGDGRRDEAWFIDPSLRHQDKNRPILVRAIDEDGDLEKDGRPDLDSDLYVVDWKADGTVDVLLDYQDNDGDNDADEMAFYFHMPNHPWFGKDVLRTWWGRDDGDDNLLWYDVDYTYYQDLCQYRCHFSGDESFVAFGLLADSEEWLSAFENPFLFYDEDGDGCGEVVLRVEGRGNEVRSIRYSFDADDDAFGRRTHDYDFSITAVAPADQPVRLPENGVTSTKLRGLPAQPWLDREHARPFVTQASWERALLTWDEMNANTEANVQRDPNERWEGVIAHKSEHFPQIGGPPCSPLNKRNELSLKPVTPLRLYHDPTDHRLHLLGANEGWLHVDYDFDGKVDARYTYLDEDGDGVFDRRQLDLDADGQVDFDWKMAGRADLEIPLDFKAISTFYKAELARTLDASDQFIEAAYTAVSTIIAPDSAAQPQPDLPGQTGGLPDSFVGALMAADFLMHGVEHWMPAAGLGAHIRKTPAGIRFYTDLVRDRLLLALKQQFGTYTAWDRIETLYAAGDFAAAALLIRQELLGDPDELDNLRFELGTCRIAVRIENPSDSPRHDWPVAIPIRQITAADAGFRAETCSVEGPEQWIAGRQIPHQIDEIDPAIGPELTFLADLPPRGAATYYITYTPEGHAGRQFTHKTGTAEDWIPPNIGWESNRVAYRAYWGQFDFFGKKIKQLIYPTIGQTSYHQEVEWGIDALHVGHTGGLGGLTLYEGDKAFLVQNPAGKGEVHFTKRQLVSGPVRAAIEFVATNVCPSRPDLTVRVLCTIYAERDESEVRAYVTGAQSEVHLAPCMVKLPSERCFEDTARGLIGAWGYQEEVIGDIGMGLIVPPDLRVETIDLKAERQLRCRLDADSTLRYWIIGDWRRGRQHPVAPTIDNWQRELSELADLLHQPVRVTLGQVEKKP